MAQNSSHLLRLPVELRDQIYEYYLREENGYLHDPLTGKLRTFAGKPINISLIHTCRVVALETKGLALRLNKITFRTMLSTREKPNTPTNAGTFQYLLWERYQALKFMLGFAHSLVTNEVLNSLSARWPGSRIVKSLRARFERDGPDFLRNGQANLQQGEYGVDEAKKDRIFEDLMQILAVQPEFNDLVAIGYTASQLDRWKFSVGYDNQDPREDPEPYIWRDEQDDFIEKTSGRKRYTDATRDKILNWQPDLWWIPSREDLEKVGEFIPGTPLVSEHGTKEYFSAAAVAIRFLNQLPLATRLQMRNIVIEEHRPSEVEPYTHARGLIRFLQENVHLHIERRVDVWHTTFITNGYYRRTIGWLWDIAAWMREAKELQGFEGRFILTLHGPSAEASQNLCDKIIEAAAWEDTNREYLRRRNESFIYWQYGICYGFSDIVQEIVQRKIPVRFDAEYDFEPWDTDVILRGHTGKWIEDADEAIPADMFLEPYEGWKAAREAYEYGPDSFSPLEDWNELLETL